ncbi:hypothetical protein TrCOL_g12562 [Triparma columacea]|uniref:Quinate/shikimate 5-dehydrogenase/glutamyl-tRNA reductase domain-containing protein n=1 Tax=Triparma columacea TaxID=722753 RepID=A0A9W7GRX4_9STRA|nr:hypothetical protein TrCOL_g12562 [Triparma columacea]
MVSVITGSVTHVIEGGSLTAIRTAAGVAVATKRIMRGRRVRRIVVVGAGRQGREHVRCLLTVYPEANVTIVNRNLRRAERLRVEMLEEFKLEEGRVKVMELGGEGVEEAVGEADVVCLCTNSLEPIFPASWYKADGHVNAVGGFTKDMREVDLEFLESCTAVVLDTETAMEVGDMLQGEGEVREGVRSRCSLLPDVLKGEWEGGGGRTFFKSVGWAAQDVAAGAFVVDNLPRGGRVMVKKGGRGETGTFEGAFEDDGKGKVVVKEGDWGSRGVSFVKVEGREDWEVEVGDVLVKVGEEDVEGWNVGRVDKRLGEDRVPGNGGEVTLHFTRP